MGRNFMDFRTYARWKVKIESESATLATPGYARIIAGPKGLTTVNCNR
jgi:hypothetical protein